MITLFRILLIECIRGVSLLFVAGASFILTAFALNVINAPFILFGDSLFTQEWHLAAVASLITFGPAWAAGRIPGFAESKMDYQMGARAPSKREQALFDQILGQLEVAAQASGAKLPRIVWKVRDSGEINAFAFGRNRVTFTKGMLHKYANDPNGIDCLAAIAAHEVGHLKNWDTRIDMIARYLLAPGNLAISIINNTICKIPIAGIPFTFLAILLRLPADIGGMLLNSTSQMCEFQADAFAAKLIGKSGLTNILDEMAHAEEWHGGTIGQHVLRSHPPSEQRHDRISQIGEVPAEGKMTP